MDFQKSDIRHFLVDSIPSRFNNLTPDEFTSLMAFVLRKDGYEVDEISKKGEHVADLMARKDNVSLVLKALLHPPGHIVHINEIQQAAGARSYYEADQAWVITTSSFSEQAKKEADKLDIELWDWDAFYAALTQLFFEGKSHIEFIETHHPPPGSETSTSEIRVKAKWKPEEGIEAEWYNLDLVVSNLSQRNVYLHLDLPVLIDSNKNQVSADQWAENEFVAGMIYSGASIKTNALFKASRLGERPPGGKIMLSCHERSDPPVTHHIPAKLKGSACYIVSFCYGAQSDEYLLMTSFRDTVLMKTYPGRAFVNFYYALSPDVIRIATQIPMVERAIRLITKWIVSLVRHRTM